MLLALAMALSVAPGPEVEGPPAASDELVNPAPAQGRAHRRRRPRPSHVPDLHYRLAVDLPITLGTGTAWLVTESLRGEIAPRQCRWCSVRDNRFDRNTQDALRWPVPDAASPTSGVVGFGLTPLLGGGLNLVGAHRAGAMGVAHEDLLIVLEAIAVSAAITQGLKMGVGRQRPYADSAEEPIPFEDDHDQNLSFPSGHTSFAFSTAVSAGMVASMRGYDTAPAVWGVGLPLAAFTGYLRIAGDRHYLSDVLMGAAIGSVTGFALPFFLHHPRRGLLRKMKKRKRSAQILPYPGGALVQMRW